MKKQRLRKNYLGITVDGYSGRPVIVVSTEGACLLKKQRGILREESASIHIDPPSAITRIWPLLTRRLGSQRTVDRFLERYYRPAL